MSRDLCLKTEDKNVEIVTHQEYIRQRQEIELEVPYQVPILTLPEKHQQPKYRSADKVPWTTGGLTAPDPWVA